MQIDAQSILKNFKIEGKFINAEKYGDGHINETLLASFDCDGTIKKYILQRISKLLTKNVPLLMQNIEYVTEFNRKNVIKRGGNPERECLMLVKSIDNKSYYFDYYDYYRVYFFIDNATSYQTVTEHKFFYEAAVAFGNFANLLAEFDASLLSDIIPNFHHTPTRFLQLMDAVDDDKAKRASSVISEIEWAKAHKRYTDVITSLLESGAMPQRVTHNDTKLNNVLFDNETGKGIAVVDMDTVMKGSLCYDFGDSIRFGCNPCSEDEKDLSKVNFRLDLFETFAKGYLNAVGNSITKIEKDHLAISSIVMTYECGIRFLTDYLSGDVYFHTNHATQNLDRARTQFKLVKDMETQLPQMQSIINKY